MNFIVLLNIIKFYVNERFNLGQVWICKTIWKKSRRIERSIYLHLSWSTVRINQWFGMHCFSTIEKIRRSLLTVEIDRVEAILLESVSIFPRNAVNTAWMRRMASISMELGEFLIRERNLSNGAPSWINSQKMEVNVYVLLQRVPLRWAHFTWIKLKCE